MSQLGALKQQIEALARQAGQLGGQLAATKQAFDRTSGQVQSVIGGSSQGRDRELMQSIQAAQRQVDQAANAMREVERKARQYGQSL